MTVALFLPPSFRTTEAWLRHLSAALPGEELQLISEIHDPSTVDIALVRGDDPGDLRGLPNLSFVQCLWAGVERLLVHPDLPEHVTLARMVDPAMADQMAATALAHVLDLHLDLHRYRSDQANRVWKPADPGAPSDRTVGILGLGALGARTAMLLRGVGFNVIGLRASARGVNVDERGIVTTPSINDVTDASDIVINLLPLTPETVGLLNAAFFQRLRRGASIINLARGGHVVDADLIAALDSGQLHRAVLDTFSIEPLPAGHPFWTHPSITVTPHVAANTDPRSASAVITDNIRAFRTGGPITGLVDRTRAY